MNKIVPSLVPAVNFVDRDKKQYDMMITLVSNRVNLNPAKSKFLWSASARRLRMCSQTDFSRDYHQLTDTHFSRDYHQLTDTHFSRDYHQLTDTHFSRSHVQSDRLYQDPFLIRTH